MALDRDRDDDDRDRNDDRTRDRDDRRQPAMGSEGRRNSDRDNPDDGDDDLAAELEKARADLKRANRESADRRKENRALQERLDAIEAAEKEAADAQLPELDKLRKQMARRDEELAESNSDREVLADAYSRLQREFAVYRASAGKVNPLRLDAVARLLDHDLIDEDEETGELRGVDKAIDRLLQDYPEFAANPAKGTPVPSRNGGGTPPRRGMNGGNGGDGDISIRDYLRATGSGGF